MAYTEPKGLPCGIGIVEGDNVLIKDMFQAAKKGDKKKIKKCLEKGANADCLNNLGQTPLIFACIHAKTPTVELLLQFGANPNERAEGGYTAVHVACYTGNIMMLVKLLEAGGDLRLHDNIDRTPKDWATRQEFYKKRGEMLEFLDKTRYFAMSYCGKDNLNARASLSHRPQVSNSLVRILKNRLSKSNISNDSQNTLGFGKVYCDADMLPGMVSLTPLVAEGSLAHDTHGPTFNNGVHTVMESMHWDKTAITVKRLHRVSVAGGDIDLLIHECEHISKLRHPCIMLIMGVCQTNNLDGMILIYERIEYGSLFFVLHVKRHDLQKEHIKTMVIQICDALIFIQQQHFAHCALTSHAVNVVTDHQVKVGNFEYMTQLGMDKKCNANQNKHKNCMYNWLSPEIMMGDSPYHQTDMFSLCVLMWEMFQADTPWNTFNADDIKSKVLSGISLCNYSVKKIPKEFLSAIKSGFNVDPSTRKVDLDQMRALVITGPVTKENNTSVSVKKDRSENNSTTDIWLSSSSESSTQHVLTPCMQPRLHDDIDATLEPEISQNLFESGFLSDREASSVAMEEPLNARGVPDMVSYDNQFTPQHTKRYERKNNVYGVLSGLSGLRTTTSRVRFNERGNDVRQMSFDEVDQVSLNTSDSLEGDTTPLNFSYLKLHHDAVSSLKPASHHVKPAAEKATVANGTIYDLYNRCNSTPPKPLQFEGGDIEHDVVGEGDSNDVSLSHGDQVCNRGTVRDIIHRLENNEDENEKTDVLIDNKEDLADIDSSQSTDHDRITTWVDNLVKRITRNMDKQCTTAVYEASESSHSRSALSEGEADTWSPSDRRQTDNLLPCHDIRNHWITEGYNMGLRESTSDTWSLQASTHDPRTATSLTDIALATTENHSNVSPSLTPVHASPAHTCLSNLYRTGTPHPKLYNAALPRTRESLPQLVLETDPMLSPMHAAEATAWPGDEEAIMSDVGKEEVTMECRMLDEGDIGGTPAQASAVFPPGYRDETVYIETNTSRPGEHVVTRTTTDLATGDVTTHSRHLVYAEEVTGTIKIDAD